MSNNDLLQAVWVGHEIGTVVKTADQMYLIALNAMLMSRRASKGGNMAAGFSRVSGELRNFSKTLESRMTQLKTNVEETVLAVANHTKQERSARIMQQALQSATSKERANNHAAIHTRSDKQLYQSQQKLNEAKSLLVTQLTQLLPICALGQTLAVSARVELIHVPESEDMLTGMVNQIDIIMHTIESSLQLILQQFGTRKAHQEAA